MKKTVELLWVLTLLALLVLTRPARAVETFAGGGTDIGTNLCYYVAPTAGGVPRVQYLNATSDKSSSVATFYTPASSTKVSTNAAASQAVVPCAGSANFSALDVVVLRHVAADTYQRLTVASVTTTNATMNENLSAAVVGGDVLYKMSSRATIPVGATTKELNAGAGGIFNGRAGFPVLIEVDGTSACQVNAVGGVYESP